MQTWVAFYVFIHPFTNYLSVSWGIDESTHQIPSNGLLFSNFYHFPCTTDPPTSTAPTQPFPTITRSPSTIPYTHRTISPVPHQRPFIWPMDHIITFSFLSLFSFTRRIPSWPDQSRGLAPHSQALSIASPYARILVYHSYLTCLYLPFATQKRTSLPKP